MEKVIAYRFRGTLYESSADAKKAIDNLIGEIITRHAHHLVHIEKYSAIVKYLESNLGDFHEAYLLTEDKTICSEED